MQRLEVGKNWALLKLARRSVWQECRDRAWGKERDTPRLSQRASRNLTGAAKELAFPRRAVGTTGAQGAAGRGWDAGEDAAPRPSWVTPDVWVPLSNLVFLQSAVREREGGRESVCVSVSVCCVCV